MHDNFAQSLWAQAPTRRLGNELTEEVATCSENSKKKKTSKIIVENPSLDLEAYAANYTGHTKIERLLFIADRCPPLAVDAYSAALQELQSTADVSKYVKVHKKLNEVLSANGKPSASLNEPWIDRMTKEARLKTEKLEKELKDYKNNMIKESIRMGYNDLGDHLYSCGDLIGAQRAYARTRDYNTTAKHIVDMCLNMIKVNIETGNLAHVSNHVVKAENAPEMPDKAEVMAKLKCAMGLVHLDSGRYKQAARSFLVTGFELGTSWTDVISPNDVANYGALCALASLDRSELRSMVFENASFKQFLELEPQTRELLNYFYNSKYAQCLEILSRMKSDLYLDLWLNTHVEILYQSIRRKALVQYITPFISVDLTKMAQAFSTTVAELEPELARLITEKEIQARIDSHNKTLKAKSSNQRSAIFERSLTMGREYEAEAKQILLRMKLSLTDMEGMIRCR
ncbi:26S proteasome subunit RPN7-domain-containing protein [Gaertneriomyces semiglobifer]|nr:26S proteasome subunit RPN7-domain-containing protein [Gaertneriomyces semiglobifer]